MGIQVVEDGFSLDWQGENHKADTKVKSEFQEI